MTILLTGATGFVGRPLLERLRADGRDVIAAVRDPTGVPDGVPIRRIDTIGPGTRWDLSGIETVVHLAARVHQKGESAAEAEQRHMLVNADGGIALARQAAAAGVKRFVFISTIKVNGETTPAERPFTAAQPPNPQDAYGRSKAAAEAGMLALAGQAPMRVTILRPPLVHGPGLRGNLRALLTAIDLNLPLPLAGADAKRSIIGIDNLIDAIRFHLAGDAPDGVHLLADPEPVAVNDLIRRLAKLMGKPALLFPAPIGLMQSASRLVRLSGPIDRLTRPLLVEIGPTPWRPPVSLDEGLERTIAGWRKKSAGTAGPA